MMKLQIVLFVLTLCCGGTFVHGDFRLSTIYSNNMMFQQEPKRNQLWGYGAEPFAEVVVYLNGQTFSNFVQKNMSWYVTMDPQPAGGPYDIRITEVSLAGQESYSLYLYNVTFGDVWLCVGEGNMGMPMHKIRNYTAQLHRVKKHAKHIRLAYYDRVYEDRPIEETGGSWAIPLDKSADIDARTFSAACLLFGVEMVEMLNRPIGLIWASYPLSPIEAWHVPDRCRSTDYKPSYISSPTEDSALWNGMIYPLTKLTIRGVIFYQGESNLNYNAINYQCNQNELIAQYQVQFFDGGIEAENNVAMPFGIVQAGTMNSQSNEEWGQLRWSQTYEQGYLPSGVACRDCFMASTYDLAEDSSTYGAGVLNRNQGVVARRLAIAAGRFLYNRSSFGLGPYPTRASRGENGFVTVVYDRNVTLQGSDGFNFMLQNGTWARTKKLMQISNTSLVVAVPSEATRLSYAWDATPCPYKRCAVYADDEDMLPAQAWLWKELRSSNPQVFETRRLYG